MLVCAMCILWARTDAHCISHIASRTLLIAHCTLAWARTDASHVHVRHVDALVSSRCACGVFYVDEHDSSRWTGVVYIHMSVDTNVPTVKLPTSLCIDSMQAKSAHYSAHYGNAKEPW